MYDAQCAHTAWMCREKEKKVCWEILADKEKAEKRALMGKTANKIVCWFLHIKRMKKQMKRMEKSLPQKTDTHTYRTQSIERVFAFSFFLYVIYEYIIFISIVYVYTYICDIFLCSLFGRFRFVEMAHVCRYHHLQLSPAVRTIFIWTYLFFLIKESQLLSWMNITVDKIRKKL